MPLTIADRRACRDRRGHHPWRFMGEHFPDWRIVFVDDLPPGRLGLTVPEERTVKLALGQNQADRRSTLAHETGHVVRGPVPHRFKVREEALCDRQAARLLLPSVRRVGHALVFHGADHEAAAETLWVDEKLLNVRLSTLAPAERAWLNDQLATVLV